VSTCRTPAGHEVPGGARYRVAVTVAAARDTTVLR
jgi:hypothetical protein